MRSEAINEVSAPQGRGRHPERRTLLVWGVPIVLVVIAHITLQDRLLRLNVLQAILILTAAGEALGGTFGVFRPRWFAERNGRPYDPAYHGVSQDFGLYNLSYALLFALAALDPGRNAAVIGAAIALYTVHGVTHILRYFGLYYGGGVPIPTRPQTFEMRDGLQLVAAGVGMILFLP